MMSSSNAYESAVAAVREPRPHGSADIDYRELVRLASLAPSSHNTQPWKFAVDDQLIRIIPDFTRRCPVVDPDDAHLFKSLGCAAENMVHAAAAQGLRAEVQFDESERVVVVHLRPDPTCHETALARAIPSRQCTKMPYNNRAADSDDTTALQRAGTGDGVRVIFLTDHGDKNTVTEFVNRGNQAQLSDRAFRDELIAWIRSNVRESLQTGDGISGRITGHPSAPSWLAKLLLPWVIRPKAQIKTDTANIAASAGVAVFVSQANDPAAWVEVGRCYERFALQATALDVRNAFINQPIEVTGLRPEFERWLGLTNEHAQLLIRFGAGPQTDFSVRRPLDEIIVATNPNTSDV